MVVNHIITYAGMIWCPRVEYKTSQVKLSKLQRLACLGITGAMRTGPTAAIEVLLWLPTLNLKIDAEARVGSFYSTATNNGSQHHHGMGM
jgi:hypothetical protein